MKGSVCLVGVAGGTGSGKSAVVRELVARLGGTAIDLDSYYIDRKALSVEERRRVNYDEPGAIDIDLLLEQLRHLAQGHAISKPVYCFQSHTRIGVEVVAPARLMIVEGLFAFWWEPLRDLMNLKVFVDAPADMRLIRRLRRDMRERSRTVDEVIDQYVTTVAAMHERYVEPCRVHADVVVTNAGPLDWSVRQAVAILEHAMFLREARLKVLSRGGSS